MYVGTILLDNNNLYVDKFGRLPKRPDFDKEFLAEFVRGCSPKSKKCMSLIPKSMQEITRGMGPTIPLSIKELNKVDLLIVVRSVEDLEQPLDGKEFRFKNFYIILDFNGLEIWKNKKFKE